MARYRSLDIEDKECHPGGCGDVSVSGKGAIYFISIKCLDSRLNILYDEKQESELPLHCIIVNKQIIISWESIPVILLWSGREGLPIILRKSISCNNNPAGMMLGVFV